MDVAVLQTIRSVRLSTFKSGDNLFTVANDAVGFGKLDKIVPKSGSCKECHDAHKGKK